ncbi:MAG: hypothetical protein ACTIJ6_09155 [Leucobacter sp.]
MELAQAVPWTPLAVLAYVATVTIGTLSLRGRRVHRRWHSTLFAVTVALTVLAGLFALPTQWVRALCLALALVPLAFLPFAARPVRAHSSRHAMLGLSAAPCYCAALALWVVQL